MADRDRTVLLLLGIETMWMASYGALVPVLTDLLMASTMGPVVYGAIESVANTVGLIMAPLLGRISDLYGRPRCIVAATAFGILSTGLFIGAHAGPRVGLPVSAAIFLVLAGRVVDNFSSGLSPTVRALMADMSAETDAGAIDADGLGTSTSRNISRLQGAFGFGFSLGAMLGGYLGERHGVLPSLYVASAFTVASFLLAVALPNGAAAPTAAAPPPSAPTTAAAATATPAVANLKASKHGAPSAWSSTLALLREAARSRSVAVLLFLRFITGIAFSIYINTDQMLLKERLGAGPEFYGVLMFGTGLVFSFTNSFLVPALLPTKEGPATLLTLLPRMDQRTLLSAGIAVLVLARLVQANATTLSLAVVGTMLAAVGGGITGTLIASLLAALSPDDRRGCFLGLSESLDRFSQTFSPLLGGLLFHRVAPAAPAATACGLTVVAFMIAWVGLDLSLMSDTKHKSE